MANFVLLTGPKGFEHINLDLVRRITEDALEGSITVYFDSTDKRTLEGADARKVMDEVNRPWREKAKVAA